MKPSFIASFQGFILLMVGIWAFIANNYFIHAALVPVLAALLFFILSHFLKRPNTSLLILCGLISLTLCIALSVPLHRNIEQGDTYGIIRLIIQIAVSAFAFAGYLRNFLHLRKAANN